MLQRIVIFFLLAMFSNTIVFPESCFPMQGMVYAHGGSAAEINSLIEFVWESCLQLEDTTPLDEEDNIPHALKFSKYLDYVANSKKIDSEIQLQYLEMNSNSKTGFLFSIDLEVPDRPPQIS